MLKVKRVRKQISQSGSALQIFLKRLLSTQQMRHHLAQSICLIRTACLKLSNVILMQVHQKFLFVKTHIMRALMICSSEDLLKTCELLLLLKPKLREPLKFFHKGENSDLNRDCLSEDLKHSTFQYWLCHANEGPSCGWALR